MTKIEGHKNDTLSWKTKVWNLVKKYKKWEIAAVVLFAMASRNSSKTIKSRPRAKNINERRQ
jgi:cytochrome b